MRRTEYKAGKWRFISKCSLIYQNLRIQYYAFLPVLDGDFSLQRALQMRKCIVDQCCGYLKHPLDSGEYVSKKSMVIRCVEPNIKQENHILSQKGALKKGSLHRTVSIMCVSLGFLRIISSLEYLALSGAKKCIVDYY